MSHPTTVIRIEIPAVDNLVQYLRERDQSVAAAAIMGIVSRLAASSTTLKSAINSQGDK